MSLTPIFPQFAGACDAFVKPRGFPRPFAALDWCPRCGQPDWAHQAGHADRVAWVRDLDPDRMADVLEYLCEYAPAAVDVACGAVRGAGDCREVGGEGLAESFCVRCGASLTMRVAGGSGWWHCYDTPGGDRRWLTADHPPVLGWRAAAAWTSECLSFIVIIEKR
jgi:hypothetical protein